MSLVHNLPPRPLGVGLMCNLMNGAIQETEVITQNSHLPDSLIRLVYQRLVLNQGSQPATQYIDLTAPPPRASAYAQLKMKIKWLFAK